MQGLSWTTAYYFKGCVSWKWAYYYNYAPCLKDIIETLDTMTTLNASEIFAIKTTPIQPFQQLLSVLPPQSSSLLPPDYAKLMHTFESPIIEYYPIEVKLENYLGYYYHYCEPHLPCLYIEDILNATEHIKLSKKEQQLNELHETHIIIT